MYNIRLWSQVLCSHENIERGEPTNTYIDELVEFEKQLVEVEDFKTLFIILEEFREYTSKL